MDAKTVGAVAALTAVSVRTLHHYDHIGLVVPSVRTHAGYRGYTALQALAAAKRDHVEPGSPPANELAARHRASIERYYDCSEEMHVGLAQMYVADERFTSYYDDVEPGLAQFVHDIVVASYP